ncbi:patatin-like phospholipase family protein [Stieleria sp. TO1_6]|uniref:patatin-like phospholipase family protein n=1 Tax=Stieleria tagensis TaxID=2956795 RepID=UPI00209B9C48|nr:patatin-like phospholipase family protein [Stieleria tagensis]MCO8121135.1 patatin-like phospholipase family protein [Stieleria tagensis]
METTASTHTPTVGCVTAAVAPSKQSNQRSAVVALGGGGARGLAHLGVMEAIGGSGVRTERIVGVSIGSLMGGLCAVDSDIMRVQAKAIGLLYSPVFSDKCRQLMGTASQVSSRRSANGQAARGGEWFTQWYGRLEQIMRHGHRLSRMIRGPSILSNEILCEAIDCLIPDIDLQDTAIPLNVVAADLVSGHRVVLERGSLRTAILASAAIPGFFPPVPWGDMLLCDIGVLDAMPMSTASSYASDLTIGVDVGGTLQRTETFGTAFEVMMRMEEIGERLCRRHARKYADIFVRPDVGHRTWYDFTAPENLIAAGRQAGEQSIRAFFQHMK